MPEQRTYFFQSCLGVFQGGGCRGAAFAGALEHAFARGVNFSGVAGTSAGSIIAALLAAGATAQQISEILGRLDFASLLVEPNPVDSSPSLTQQAGAKIADWFYPGISATLKHLGRYSSAGIDTWLNRELKSLLPRVSDSRVRFEHLSTPVWIVATDLVTRDVQIWSSETTPKAEVAHAVRCSCSIPGFFQAVEGRYVDGGLLSNLPSFAFPADNRTGIYAKRILAFTLHSDLSADRMDTPFSYFQAIVNTAIDGASNVQARLVESVHEIRIPTGSISSTDFAGMNTAKVTELTQYGRTAAKDFLDMELGKVRSTSSRRAVLEGDDEVLAEMTTILNSRHISKLFVVDDASKWLYSIFPAFLNWRSNGVEIHAYLPSSPTDKHELYRRRLLVELGINILPLDTPPFKGFLMDPQNDTESMAIVYVEESVNSEVRATRYGGPDDAPAIRALYAMLRDPEPVPMTQRPTLERCSDIELINKLKNHVTQYAQASMQMQTIKIQKLLALSKLVREYKYQQVKSLHSMFLACGLQPFEVAIVRYPSGKSTIVTPPVVEESGEGYFLIQGTTRAVFCLREGIEELRCLVVRNPSAPLPSQTRTPIREVLVGARTISTVERYGQKIDQDFRRIEYAVHYPSESLV